MTLRSYGAKSRSVDVSYKHFAPLGLTAEKSPGEQ
jgi:hypothetical protein